MLDPTQGLWHHSNSMATADGWHASRDPLVSCSSPVESGLSIECGVYQGVVSRRTTNWQIDVPAEHHVRKNITLKPGNVSKHWDAMGRQDFANGMRPVRACTSTLLTKSDQRIPSIWRWHFMWKAFNAFMSVARRVQISAAYNGTNKTRAWYTRNLVVSVRGGSFQIRWREAITQEASPICRSRSWLQHPLEDCSADFQDW